MGDTGLEPVTPSLSSKGTPNVSVATKALAETLADACTAACTSEAEKASAGPLDADPAGHQNQDEKAEAGDPLAKLADALLALDATDRERLAAMLAAQGEGRADA